MYSNALFFSTLFLIISAVSVILGVLILLAGLKQRTNRLFFAVSILLGIWSFGFAAASSVTDPVQCLVWRRLSAFGWSLLFAVNVHFILSLTGHGRLLKKPWIYALIYLPAALCVWVFSLSGRMTTHQYNLVLVQGVWTNEQVNNGWDFFFYGYLVVSFILTMALLIHKYMKSPDKEGKYQARALLFSFGAAILLGTITDLVNSTFQLLPFPQVAPVAFIIPIIAIDFSMNKHNLMVQPADNELEIILTDKTKNRSLLFLSVGLICGSIMYFVTQYVIDKGPFLQISISSAILFAVGIIVALSQRLTTKNNIFDILVIGIAIVAIPTVTISFITYAGLTVWAFPFIFVLISMLFNNRRLLIASSIVIALTQTLIWILKPTVDVNINASDYLVRFGIFGISIWIAFYVNKTYIRRLKENAEKNMHQKLVSDISSLLLSLRDYNKEEKIHCLLEEIADRFSTGTVFLYLADPSVKGSFDVTVLSSGAVRKSLTTSEDANRTLIEMLCTNPVNDTLGPVNSSHWKLFLSENNLQSVVSQPIIQDGVGMGFIGMASDKPVSWSEDQVSTLSVLSNILADSASRLAAENEIEFMAYHDHLTRLPNRLLFSDRTEQAISLASRNATMIGVIFLDLDSFKNVNDTFGHRFGDELIREVSEKLVTRVRKSDTVSRFGGDEFLIMLNNMGSRHDIIQVTDSIMQLFDNPVHLNGQELYITASAGIAVYPLDGETTDVLIKNADIAMYNAKDKGMNQYMFCSEDMKEDILYKAQLTNHLYHVLDRSELKVYFQPQVSLQTKQIVGAEALLRWFHPEFGLVSPGTFIPLAEKSGVINKIGEWVLRETCRQARLWHDMGLPPIRMAVNISANQLRNPRFAELVEQILAEYQLAPEYLELEVTESVAIREPAYIVALLNQLKNIGVQLSIDDFGTEYSSLSRLKQLPADRIKIDMQFVQGIDKSEKDRAISKVIINLAKSLHIKVIAEGVENKEQLSYLDEKLCDEVQGFFYYKPMPPVELEMILIRMKESELSAG